MLYEYTAIATYSINENAHSKGSLPRWVQKGFWLCLDLVIDLTHDSTRDNYIFFRLYIPSSSDGDSESALYCNKISKAIIFKNNKGFCSQFQGFLSMVGRLLPLSLCWGSKASWKTDIAARMQGGRSLFIPRQEKSGSGGSEEASMPVLFRAHPQWPQVSLPLLLRLHQQQIVSGWGPSI